MNLYPDDELLMLSGIQHIAFCERQWALIHIEQQWQENRLTIEGHHLHKKVDDPLASEWLKNKIILRSLQVVSFRLGIYGIADLVELLPFGDSPSAKTIQVADKEGWWQPVPVEYKRGKPKEGNFDKVQLCAQAICIEEMYNISITNGYLYYGETRHRLEVEFENELRNLVEHYCTKMHYLFDNKLTPAANYEAHCKACSLFDICLPRQISKNIKAANYLENQFNID
jgi:CRISPR-associated exonuclease Cas4